MTESLLCRLCRCLTRFCCGPDRKVPTPPGTPIGKTEKPRVARTQILFHLKPEPNVNFDKDDEVLAYLRRDPTWQSLERQSAFGPLKPQRAIALAPGVLKALVGTATNNASRYGFSDFDPQFNRYFTLPLPISKSNPYDLYCGLKESAIVAFAHISAPTQPTSSLAYRLPTADRGIGASVVLPQIVGASPSIADVQIADLELDWPDGLAIPELKWHPDQKPSRFDADIRHGAQTYGVIAGTDPIWGVDGVSVGVKFWRCPILIEPAGSAPTAMLASAILGASAVLNPGDIILVEQAISGQQPVELDPLVFDAIRTAVAAKDLIVIEPAGNAGQFLHDFTGTYNVAGVATPRQLSCAGIGQHSGAIMVVAGLSGESNPAEFGQATLDSNVGDLADCWAWGDTIRTFNVASNGATYQLVQDLVGYGGTSGAAAIIAGAVALMQGVRKRASQPPLNAMEVRSLLLRYGRLGADQYIGGIRMPDVEAMLDELRKTPHLPARQSPCPSGGG